MNPRSLRLGLLVAPFLFAASAAARAEISYLVSVQPDAQKLGVEMIVPAHAGPVSVQIPNWAPGAYVYGNFYENVHDVSASDAHGAPLQVSHPDNNTWSVNALGNGPVHFTYWVPSNNRRFGGGNSDASFTQISGPPTYMYVVNRKTEPCRVTFRTPGNARVYIGLDEARGQANTYMAPNYDTLADNPASTGNVIVDTYTLRGKTHFIVLEGAAKSKVDRQRLMHDCRFVSAAETDLLGNIPYNKYVWHFSVFDAPDGAGGLEHLSSTQITLSSGEGPRAQSVLAHEFFHLWNVKRSRPRPLGPFNYLELPKTGLLWWYEGVTDYYASLVPYRYGLWNRAQFYDQIIRNMNAVRSNPARLEISPYDASYRVAEANNGRGNSNGLRISYYNLGWLCGMLLDNEIRYQTKDRHSLDDVLRALYQECKDGRPGVAEDEIRKQCIRFGGPALGPFYDRVVMKPGELPIEEELAKVGLAIQESDEHYASVGFRAQGNFGGGGMTVRDVAGPAFGKLDEGDVIVSINGQTLDGDPRSAARVVNAQIEGAKVGTPLSLIVKRDNSNVDVTIDPVDATRKVRTVIEQTNATPAQIALRDSWLMTKKPAVE